MPSVIMNELPSYHFYLSLANQQVLKTQTKIMEHLPRKAPEFIMRPELRLDHIAAEHARIAAEAAERQSEAQDERKEVALRMQVADKEVQAELKIKREQEQQGQPLNLPEMDF
jgi:hypothetical protein